MPTSADLCCAVRDSPAMLPLRTAEDALPTEKVSMLSTPKKQLNHLAQACSLITMTVRYALPRNHPRQSKYLVS
jgi:hypothetical protein